MSILERIQSTLRERRITAHARAAMRAQRQGDPVAARVSWLRMSREIEQRTPEQVVRMERDRRLERRRQG